MMFEDYGDEDRAAAAGLVQVLGMGGVAPIWQAIDAFDLAHRYMPFTLANPRRRLHTQARAVARWAGRFAVTDLNGALVAYLDWVERTGECGAEDLDRLTVDLITAALAFDRSGDSTALEAAALKLARGERV